MLKFAFKTYESIKFKALKNNIEMISFLCE